MDTRHRSAILLILIDLYNVLCTAEAGLYYPAKDPHHTAGSANGVN